MFGLLEFCAISYACLQSLIAHTVIQGKDECVFSLLFGAHNERHVSGYSQLLYWPHPVTERKETHPAYTSYSRTLIMASCCGGNKCVLNVNFNTLFIWVIIVVISLLVLVPLQKTDSVIDIQCEHICYGGSVFLVPKFHEMTGVAGTSAIPKVPSFWF